MANNLLVHLKQL